MLLGESVVLGPELEDSLCLELVQPFTEGGLLGSQSRHLTSGLMNRLVVASTSQPGLQPRLPLPPHPPQFGLEFLRSLPHRHE